MIMANRTIKPNTRKEPLSKKKVVSIRKTTKSTKKLDVQLKVSCASGSETTVDVSLKIRKSKVITFAEAHFDCPSPNCNYVISRYRNLFDHFADHCQPEGFERFRWWCDTCQIPRFWLMGSDLVRHRQVVHNLLDSAWPEDLTFPSNFLSWMSVPEGFNTDKLLEHNVKFFGNKKNIDEWEEEVELYQHYDGKGAHTVIFQRPDREGVSKRKRDNADRVYGTKKRPSKSKKNLKVVAITESDGATDMVVAGDDDMNVSVDVLEVSFGEECANEVMNVVVDNVVGEAIPDKSSIEKLISTSGFEIEDHGYVKHLLDVQETNVRELRARNDKIAELEKMLEVVKASSKKAIAAATSACDLRVHNIGLVARAEIDAMADAYVAVQPTVLSEVITLLQSAAVMSVPKRTDEAHKISQSAIANLDKAMSTESSE